tara:strand:- start:87196 stop:88821 length:1626 start_codon:yes stop_codon:yes gene_type:complete
MKTQVNLFLSLFLCLPLFSLSQLTNSDLQELEELNWQNLNWKEDKILGASVELAYEEILKNKISKKTIIVAVLDNGIDIQHEDLKNKIWINEDEIPGNQIDDDNNGFIDDIYGWNFLGNSQGQNIGKENLEMTRVYREYLAKIENGELDSNSYDGPKAEIYNKAKKLYREEWNKRNRYLKNNNEAINIVGSAKELIKELYGVDVKNIKDLSDVNPAENRQVMRAKSILFNVYDQGLSLEDFQNSKEQNEKYTLQYLNLDLNAREIIGDNPYDINDKNYGNSDVRGPFADHGTACAGLIAAERNNGIGINGVADNVKIMCLRTTPSGDERDKDVALAIRYAVDNGAHIINMSFGKELSPEKEFVDEAIKYAEEKGVLIVHSAGNSANDLREIPAFPNEIYLDGKQATNMITVGATSHKPNNRMMAVFSNYGGGIVDILGPGVDIVSLDTGNTYSSHSGTSFSGPMVSGVAAVIWSYYPELSVEELIRIMVESSKSKKPKKVYPPNQSGEKMKKVKIEEICGNGGVVNLYKALEMLASQEEET